MATQLQIRRGTSSQVAAFTGAEGEIVVNTTNDSVHVNDGSTAGGFELARADLNNVSDASLNAALTGNTVSALTITTLTLGSTAITATGAEINILDGVTATAAELNILDGVTSTTAELNILDGVTSTAAELNILDGVTATTAELNHVDGVTSAIQTQLDAKAPLASPTFTGTVTTAALSGTSATFTTADNSDNLTLVSTDADASSGPNVKLYRNSSSPADNDFLGNIKFVGRNDNSQDVQYAEQEVYILDASDGTEDGLYNVNVMTAGANTSYMQFKAGSGVVFNEDSNDIDFRVESDGNANMLFVDGGEDRVGVGTNSPNALLHVGGTAETQGSQANPAIQIGSTTGYRLGMYTDAEGGYIENKNGDNGLIFRVKTAGEAMRIDGGTGNVGIGETNLTGTALQIRRSGSAGIVLKETGVAQFYVEQDTNAKIRWTNSNNLIFSGGANGTTERARLDTSGNFLVGKASQNTSAVGVEARSNGLLVATRDGGQPLLVDRLTSDGNLVLFHKDSTTVGSINAQQGSLSIGGSGTGAIYFNGGTDVRPWNKHANSNADNTLNLGSSNSRWEEFFCANATINTSDRNEKQDIELLSDAEMRVAKAAKGLLRKYRWKSAVAEKGDDARIHFGIIAQDLQDAFTEEGLDAARYAMFCSDTWTNDDGSEQTRLGVRYSELLAFIISAI